LAVGLIEDFMFAEGLMEIMGQNDYTLPGRPHIDVVKWMEDAIVK
jgi:hypothetical protein